MEIFLILKRKKGFHLTKLCDTNHLHAWTKPKMKRLTGRTNDDDGAVFQSSVSTSLFSILKSSPSNSPLLSSVDEQGNHSSSSFHCRPPAAILSLSYEQHAADVVSPMMMMMMIVLFKVRRLCPRTMMRRMMDDEQQAHSSSTTTTTRQQQQAAANFVFF